MAEDKGVDFSGGDSLMVDLNDVEEMSFEVIPRGIYPAIVVENEFGHSQTAGNPMWSLQYELTEGEFEGRKLFSHMVWAGKGMGITKRHLSRLAPELLEGPIDPKDPETINSILGKRCRLRLTIRKYEGEDRNNVADVLPAEDGAAFV